MVATPHFLLPNIAALVLASLLISGVVLLLVKRPLIGVITLACGALILFLGFFVNVKFSTGNRSNEIPRIVQQIDIPNDALVILPPTTSISGNAGKLWVDNWAEYANQNRRAWQMLRVESSDTCTTVDEAREQAISRAAQQLRPLVIDRMQSSTPGRTLQTNQLNATIAASLRNGQGVVDQYVRENRKPYGTLWKYYLLADRSPATIDPITTRFGAVVATRTSRDITTWGSLAALVLVIVLVYAFLNSATKGYFVWRLRTAMILLSIVAVLVVMARF